MRREERHHLKENPLAVALVELQRRVTSRGRALTLGIVVILGMLAATGAFFAWRGLQEQQAGDLLAEAMSVMNAQIIPPPAPSEPPADTGAETQAPATPNPIPLEQPAGSYPSQNDKFEAALPKLLAVAESYPSTAQGITARYEAAAVLVMLGRAEEAIPHYRQVIDTAGDDIYGQMATLGLAEAHLSAGQYPDAIALLEARTGSLDSSVPVDAVLMRLGRAYLLAGRSDDALAAFTRVLEEFPISVYYADAQEEVDALRQDGGDASGE